MIVNTNSNIHFAYLIICGRLFLIIAPNKSVCCTYEEQYVLSKSNDLTLSSYYYPICMIKIYTTSFDKKYTLKTLVLATRKFVFYITQSFSHIWKTYICDDLTQTLVLERTTQILCGTWSPYLKTFCLQQGTTNLRPHAPELGVLSTELWVTQFDDTIIILIVTVSIKYITVKLKYIRLYCNVHM